MGKWRHLGRWEEWEDDDPAIRRMRDALAGPLRDGTTAPEPPEPVAVAPLDVAEEVASLTRAVRAGDRSALDRLRHLLGR